MRVELVNKLEHEPFRLNVLLERLLKLQFEQPDAYNALTPYEHLTIRIYLEQRNLHLAKASPLQK